MTVFGPASIAELTEIADTWSAVSMSVPVTKSEAVHQRIVAAIREGVFVHGERLPGEHSLAERYKVSRQTIRVALADLQRDGYIATQAGSGSFVTFDGQELTPTGSWSSALASKGVASSTRILRFETIDDAELAQTLGLTEHRFIAVDRVRTSDSGTPISLEYSRIPVRAELRELRPDGLINGSLTATLEQAGVVTDAMEEWATVERLDAETAPTVGQRVGVSWLRLKSVARDDKGQIVEFVDSRLDPAHFHLHHTYRKAHND
jgi:GntR family transcriptional regulator